MPPIVQQSDTPSPPAHWPHYLFTASLQRESRLHWALQPTSCPSTTLSSYLVVKEVVLHCLIVVTSGYVGGCASVAGIIDPGYVVRLLEYGPRTPFCRLAKACKRRCWRPTRRLARPACSARSRESSRSTERVTIARTSFRTCSDRLRRRAESRCTPFRPDIRLDERRAGQTSSPAALTGRWVLYGRGRRGSMSVGSSMP